MSKIGNHNLGEIEKCHALIQDLAKALQLVTDQLERVGDNRKDAEFIEIGRSALAMVQP